jgi:hypothetical protein
MVTLAIPEDSSDMLISIRLLVIAISCMDFRKTCGNYHLLVHTNESVLNTDRLLY